MAEWKLADTWDHAVDGDSATVDFTGLAGANDIMIVAEDVTKQTTGVLRVFASVDNGVSFFTSSGEYQIIAQTGVKTATAALANLHQTNATAARSGAAIIHGASVAGVPKPAECMNADPEAAFRTRYFVADTDPIDAARIDGSGGGNLTGGKIYCLVRR